MITDWVFEENLLPLLTEVGQLIGYAFDEDDRIAIQFGMENTDSEAGWWFEYEFRSKSGQSVKMRLSDESGCSTKMVEFSSTPDVEKSIALLIGLCQTYNLKPRN